MLEGWYKAMSHHAANMGVNKVFGKALSGRLPPFFLQMIAYLDEKGTRPKQLKIMKCSSGRRGHLPFKWQQHPH